MYEKFHIYDSRGSTIRKVKQSNGSASSSDDPKDTKENTEMETKEVSCIKLVMFSPGNINMWTRVIVNFCNE